VSVIYIASTSPKEWNAPIIHVSESDDHKSSAGFDNQTIDYTDD
jgi:hypothetical protein